MFFRPLQKLRKLQRPYDFNVTTVINISKLRRQLMSTIAQESAIDSESTCDVAPDSTAIKDVKDNVISAAFTSEDVKMTSRHLIDLGFHKYLRSRRGRRSSAQDANTCVTRMSLFVLWAYSRVHHDSKLTSSNEVLEWCQDLIMNRFNLLQDYAETHLEKERGFSAATIDNYLSAIHRGIKWIIFILPHSAPSAAASTESTWQQDLREGLRYKSIETLIQDLRKSYAKDKREQRSVDKSMANEIRNRRLPLGGLASTKRYLDQIGSRFLKKYQHVGAMDVDKKGYRTNHQLILGYWYVRFPQGRASGVADMRVKDHDKLMAYGQADSTKFKTYARYGYQPVTNVKEAIPFLLKNMEWRPRAIANNGGVESSDHLFLQFNGKKPIQVGKLLNAMCTGMNVHMTSNSFRSLHETRATTLERQGIISHADREAIHSINGHTSKVTMDHYYRENQIGNVHKVRKVMERADDLERGGTGVYQDVTGGAIYQDVTERSATDPGLPWHPSPTSNQSMMMPATNQAMMLPHSSEDFPHTSHDHATSQPLPISKISNEGAILNDLIRMMRSSDSEDEEDGRDMNASAVELPISISPSSFHHSGQSVPGDVFAIPSYQPQDATVRLAPRWPASDYVEPIRWGTAHPDYHKHNPQRVTWSDSEVGYIVDWEKANCSPYTSNKVKKCLTHIQNDPAAISIFHPNHTLNTSRLREGFNKARKLA